MKAKFTAYGHGNVTSLHETTLMFTSEDYVTPTGDCIIGVKSSLTLPDLPEEFRERMKSPDARLRVLIECGGRREEITAYGHPGLEYRDPKDMVVRKSGYTCPRTLAVGADKAAIDLDRGMVEEMRGCKEIKVVLTLD